MRGVLSRKNAGRQPGVLTGGLRLTYRRAGGRNWLDTVVNPKGKLQPLVICQTEKPGFTVRQAKTPFNILSYGHRNAEKLAIKLAKKGHKKVSFWD